MKNKIVWYLASRYFVLGLQFLASIFLAVKLGAYYFGIWSFILLLIAIGTICNWGISNALTIFLVQYKTDEEKARQYTFCSTVLTAAASFLPVSILLYDRFIGIPLFEKYHIGNFVYFAAGLIVLQYLVNLFTGIYRVKGKINEITFAQTVWPVFMLVLLFFANERKLLWLLCGGYAFAQSLALLVFLRGDGLVLKGRLDRGVCKEILNKGFYLFLYNASFALIVLSTKTIISYTYSVKEFGYFTFGYSLAQGIMMLTDSLIFLLFPKMIDMLKGNDPQKSFTAIKTLRIGYLIPLHLLLYSIVIFCGIFFNLLPQYKQSETPFVLILFTLVTYSQCFGYNSYLLAQNKEKQFALIVILALVLNIVCTWLLTNIFGCQFKYAILGTFAAYAAYITAVNSYALFLLKGAFWYKCVKEIFSPELTICFVLALSCFLLGVQKPFFILFPVLLLIINRDKIKQIFGIMIRIAKDGNAIDI